MTQRLAHQEKQRTRNEFWGGRASDYDRVFDPLESRLYAELENDVLREFTQPSPGKTILDLCSGTGRNSLLFADSGAQIIGIDAAAGMVEVATQKAADARLENVTYIHGSAFELPFPDETFDAVIGTRFMYMMSRAEKQRIVAELDRVLKPGGVAALQFNGGFWGIKHELTNLFRGRPARFASRYLWPAQIRGHFPQMRVERLVGVKLPWLAVCSKVVGDTAARRINHLARWPVFRFASAYLVVKVVKPVDRGRR
jgi:ubiquinone/menaquinone biosynthesis C-methylase UbiE